MLDLETRTAILRLREEGHGTRFIAKAVGVARRSVVRVLEEGHAEVPKHARDGQLSDHLDTVRELHGLCKGNLVRVREELLARHGVEVAYSTLTRFCRSEKIGVKLKKAAGRYRFEPGEEMQHDTSPHRVEVGGREVALQCASVVMCFSRRRFIQCYPRWTRFHVKAFLTRALRYFGAAPAKCMLDNSTVIMTGGTGKDARPVPEMRAFSDRFGLEFVAHEAGDANRSARVEGPFWHVENNFYPGRTFADLDDLNAQLLAWCDAYNAERHKSFDGVPNDLWRVELAYAKPLPAYVPEPTDVHSRRVDAEGFVHLHTNRYSVPEDHIGRALEVHETLEFVRVFLGKQLVAQHRRLDDGQGGRQTSDEHHGQRMRRGQPRPPSREEVALRAAGPALAALCDAHRRTASGGSRAILRLHRIWLDYPDDVVEGAVEYALQFGLVDPSRIERMVLERIRGDYFKIPLEDSDG